MLNRANKVVSLIKLWKDAELEVTMVYIDSMSEWICFLMPSAVQGFHKCQLS